MGNFHYDKFYSVKKNMLAMKSKQCLDFGLAAVNNEPSELAHKNWYRNRS
jgi:hypothetical protein